MQYSAGGVVVGPGNKIVVVNQNGDSWSLPKGHLEENEDPEDAATREIFEESGIQDVKIIDKLGEYERTTTGYGGVGEQTDNIKHITIFLCITNQTELAPIDPNNPEAIWMSIQDVADKLTHPKDKEFFYSITPKLLKFLAS
jgi:ADP-ribose pyrophosphatase YjhB (NUDIX family)